MDKIIKYQKAEIIIPKCEITEVGLIIDEHINFEQWVEIGKFLDKVEGTTQWMRGDWLQFGYKKGKWGIKTFIKKLDWNYTSARICRYVAEKIEIVRRRTNLSFAHHQEVSSLPFNKQEYWFDKAEREGWTREELRKQIREAKIEKPGPLPASRGLIYKKDALEFLADINDKSTDLLLTDPPYMTDLDNVAVFATEWVPLALSKIKATGRAYIFTGAYPTELQAYLSVLLGQNNFTLDNILIWTYRNTMGPSPKMGYKLNWQAVFYLYGRDAPALECPRLIEQFTVQEFNQPFSKKEPRYSTWQKPFELAEMFIRHGTKKDDLIIDPFAGTGTFIIQAIKMGRKAMGAEINDKMIKACKKRGLTIE